MVEITTPKISFGEYKNQLIASIIANIISLSVGTSIGWLSPALPIIQSEDSPLTSGPVTVEEASWLGSLFSIGAIAGNFIFGFLANSHGRKLALCLIAIPQTAFWITLIFGYDIIYLYVARILAGIAGGGTYVCASLYVSDIASNEVRGSLGTLFLMGLNCGTLLGFILGSELSYNVVPIILISLPIIFFLLVVFLPETPQFLMLNKNDEERAKKSVAFYRNLNLKTKEDTAKVDSIIDEIKKSSTAADVTKQDKLTMSDFTNPTARKALLIGVGIVTVHILSGCFAIINYTTTIFEASKSDISTNTSAIIVAVVQVVGTYISTIVVDRFGRKVIFATTACGASLGFIVMGIYSFLSSQYDLSVVNWIPVASVSFSICVASIGLLPLTFVVLAEILPAKIRPVGCSLCNVILNLLAFGMLKVFPILIVVIDIYGVMWLCGGICLIGVVFILVCIPETKGKSI